MAGFEMPDMDQEMLAELQDIMGADFATLVESWRRDTRNRMSAIEQALETGDAAALRQTAHSLKGSSSNLGARCVVSVCIELEKLANLKDLAGAATQLDALRQAVDSAEQELLRLAT